MSYIICIPSYKRPEILRNKTLKLLNNCNISAKNIYIFVASEEEKEEYMKVISNTLYNAIIVGIHGIHNQRNFIRSYFPEDTHIVSIDDDIEEIYKLSHDGKSLVSLTELEDFIQEAFDTCHKNNLYIWGIYPAKNIFYMSQSVTFDLKFIIGTFYGYINRNNKDLYVTLPEKEDYETTIQHFIKDNGVLRFNNVCLKTKYHKHGGIGPLTKDRYLINEQCAERLYLKYPEYGFVWKRKKGIKIGMTEFRLYPKKVYEAKLRQATLL